MQSDNNQIYKITAERTGESEDLYKDIGNFVFKALAENMKRPETIIIKLKGLGYWYLRRNRMDIITKIEIPPFEFKGDSPMFENIERISYNNKVEMRSFFVERLKDYEKYVELRNQIKKSRNEYKESLESSNGEDKSSETSKDNLE